MQMELNQEQLKFVEKQSRCALCGTEVEIKTDANYEECMIREEAYCKNCDIKTRVREHTLQ